MRIFMLIPLALVLNIGTAQAMGDKITSENMETMSPGNKDTEAEDSSNEDKKKAEEEVKTLWGSYKPCPPGTVMGYSRIAGRGMCIPGSPIGPAK